VLSVQLHRLCPEAVHRARGARNVELGRALANRIDARLEVRGIEAHRIDARVTVGRIEACRVEAGLEIRGTEAQACRVEVRRVEVRRIETGRASPAKLRTIKYLPYNAEFNP
jgi:hypothetical protein